MNLFFLTYLLHPKICHRCAPRHFDGVPPSQVAAGANHSGWRARGRFVGYLEEEAVKTYTDILDAIDNGAPLGFRGC